MRATTLNDPTFHTFVRNDEEFPLISEGEDIAGLLDVYIDIDASSRGAWTVCRVGVQGYKRSYGYRSRIRWLDDDCALAKAIYERINTPEYQEELSDWVRDRMDDGGSYYDPNAEHRLTVREVL